LLLQLLVSDLGAAEWALWLRFYPSFDAALVEIVRFVARQGRHIVVFFKFDHADAAAFNLPVEFSAVKVFN